jgi:sulfatase modifying factor 1
MSRKQGGSACCPPARDPSPLPAQAASEQSLSNAADLSNTIYLESARFLMGSDHEEVQQGDGEGPVREVALSGFVMDQFPVTNARFSIFVKSTGYVTEAERYGWSFVFWSHIPRQRFWQLVENTVADAPWWCKTPGAKWDSPEGPGSTIQRREDHPVVHVSWNDAQAFCAWAGKRLLTEAEWEYGARGGLVQKVYPWGDKLRQAGQHRCNIWQGEFPKHDTADDGYAGTCPVDAFPANGFGIYSVSGNTWEWCADWWTTEHDLEAPIIDPRGPASGTNCVMRGGSFLCHKSYCNRYRVSARTSQTPDSSTSNIGFRCATLRSVLA